MNLRMKYKLAKKKLEDLKNTIINDKQISDQNLILLEVDNLPTSVAGDFYELFIKLKEKHKDKDFIVFPKNMLEIYNLSEEEYDCLNNIISRKNE